MHAIQVIESCEYCKHKNNGGRTPPLFLCRYYNVRFKVVLVYLYLLCSTERLSGVPEL